MKEKNNNVRRDSSVYLRREVHEVGRNPKLDDQVDGRYRVVKTDGRDFKLRIGDDIVPVSSDRITPAPKPADTPARTNPGDALPPPVNTDEDGAMTPDEDNIALEGE